MDAAPTLLIDQLTDELYVVLDQSMLFEFGKLFSRMKKNKLRMLTVLSKLRTLKMCEKCFSACERYSNLHHTIQENLRKASQVMTLPSPSIALPLPR